MSSSNYDIPDASDAQNKMLASIAQDFQTSDEHLEAVANEVYGYLSAGLQNDGAPRSLPSHISYIRPEIIRDIKQASRDGCVALGLTINTTAQRIKIASITFDRTGGDAINKQIFLPQAPINTASDFFEAAATDVAVFINSHNLAPDHGQPPLLMGVTIDLPLEETGKNNGRVVGSGRKCPSIFENVDIAQGLNAVLIKKHLPVRVTSTTNCVISTLVVSQNRFHNTSVALILNHGVNAAYYEATSKIAKISDTELGSSNSRIAINTELAHYGKGSQVLKRTQWDNRIDRESENTGDHIFEKLVADKYLGEIVRNLITDFMDAQLLFPRNADATTFSQGYSFYTSYMIIMEDCSPDLCEVGNLLAAGFNIQSSVVDRRIVRALCKIVAMRAARLVGAACAAIVKKSSEALPNPEPVVASISGQLTDMNQPTAESLIAGYGLEKATFYILGEDGYTVGAALTSLSR
ncbi:actin-like ATPase domain-containing protein [Martensiomyces pterosporus]|nr:actin-like ATPase domain-containing protein [Martensiomyces pterosporus]